MNTLKIASDGEITRLTLNGVNIGEKCYGFRLEQSGGELPILHLDLVCDEIDVSAAVVAIEE